MLPFLFSRGTGMDSFFSCPHCEWQFAVDQRLLGENVACPQCHTIFPVAGHSIRQPRQASAKAHPILAGIAIVANRHPLLSCLAILVLVGMVRIAFEQGDAPKVQSLPAATPAELAENMKAAEADKKAQEQRATQTATEIANKQAKHVSDINKLVNDFSDKTKWPGILKIVGDHEGAEDDDCVTITVDQIWCACDYHSRLTSAKAMWNQWATIHSPDDPSKSKICVVDIDEREVGGANSWSGFWVKQQKEQ